MDFRKASVTYGDLRGEVAIDGYLGPFLDELAAIAEIPNTHTHFPVGISIWGGEGVEVSDEFSLTIAAVKKADYGDSIDEIRRNIKNGAMSVDTFHARIKLEEFFKYVKRINITAIHSSLKDHIISVQN